MVSKSCCQKDNLIVSDTLIFFPPELKTIMAQNIGKEMYTLKIDL